MPTHSPNILKKNGVRRLWKLQRREVDAPLQKKGGIAKRSRRNETSKVDVRNWLLKQKCARKTLRNLMGRSPLLGDEAAAWNTSPGKRQYYFFSFSFRSTIFFFYFLPFKFWEFIFVSSLASPFSRSNFFSVFFSFLFGLDQLLFVFFSFLFRSTFSSSFLVSLVGYGQSCFSCLLKIGFFKLSSFFFFVPSVLVSFYLILF